MQDKYSSTSTDTYVHPQNCRLEYPYVTGSGKTGRSHTFINPRNANYKYSIQYISGTSLAALHESTVIHSLSVYQLLNG